MLAPLMFFVRACAWFALLGRVDEVLDALSLKGILHIEYTLLTINRNSVDDIV